MATSYSSPTRILAFPYYDSLAGARLEAIGDERRRGRSEIVLDYAELRLSAKLVLCVVGGRPAERGRGHYVPRRLRFPGGEWYVRRGPFEHLDALPREHTARTVFGAVRTRHLDKSETFFFEVELGQLWLRARHCLLEERPGPVEPVEFVRHWSATPPRPSRLVLQPKRLHEVYAGDPIAISLRGRRHHHRLFIGGIRHQDQQGRRPAVDGVLNLCEMPNAWLTGSQHPSDRWSCKGEGSAGMDAATIIAEAEWVVERLRAEQRVLVHCYAGINRSSTICCAALILLEGLTAEAALARVRERHPDAWPDPYHWLLLRWLARTSGSAERRLRTLRQGELASERHPRHRASPVSPAPQPAALLAQAAPHLRDGTPVE
ncbi:MAG: dual specificity protein phosphatase family protein [Ktedonobacterales bacterium]|nr:dual specificity protein phosphatase family protein [Ktedonobacterales bacterium]